MENRIYYGEYSLAHWIKLILTKNIVIPEYQRYFVWKKEDIINLIEAFKEKLFVPPVTIGAFKGTDMKINYIIDGQQRLTSILLSYLGLYPDKIVFNDSIESFADENDDALDENEQQYDNVIKWNFKVLTDKGNNREEILSKIIAGNYSTVNYRITDEFFNETFLGFSYLVPSVSNEKEQQKYYSSVFRNINIQGTPLLLQESREALYFLDKDLIPFFKPDFYEQYNVKILNKENKIDFVRYLSLLSQYKKDGNVSKVARGYKTKMEQYYEEYIDAVISDSDSKFGKFTTIFPDKEYDDRFLSFKSVLIELNVPREFNSMIEMDIYLFGLIFRVILNNDQICLEDTQRARLKAELNAAIEAFKNDSSHAKSPSNLSHLRQRITKSIEIYENY